MDNISEEFQSFRNIKKKWKNQIYFLTMEKGRNRWIKVIKAHLKHVFETASPSKASGEIELPAAKMWEKQKSLKKKDWKIVRNAWMEKQMKEAKNKGINTT